MESSWEFNQPFMGNLTNQGWEPTTVISEHGNIPNDIDFSPFFLVYYMVVYLMANPFSNNNDGNRMGI